ncbi:MAG: glycosyltransferase [Solirubrobacteraceae bacterium]
MNSLAGRSGDGGGRGQVLYVLADLPDPPRGGNDLRYSQNLRMLAELGWQVHVVAGAARADRARAGVGDHAQLVRAVPIPPSRTNAVDRVRRVAGIARGAVSRVPVDPWAQAHRAAGFDAAVLEVARGIRPDALVIRSLFAHLIPQLRRFTGPIVVDLHDADALQARALLGTVPPLARPGILLRLGAARRAERLLRVADELWVTSRVEADYLGARGIRTPSILVRNAVAVAGTAPARGEPSPELLLVAGYGYPPNLAAAERLVEEVLPLVRRSVEARVTLVGRDLPLETARRWSSLPGVAVLGAVDDLSGHLERAAGVVFLPSWSTGTPLKIAEALAYGLPLVANSIAVAGLEGLRDGEHFLLADSSRAAAKQVVRLITDRCLHRRLVAAGWAYARGTLSYDAALHAVATQSVMGRVRAVQRREFGPRTG